MFWRVLAIAMIWPLAAAHALQWATYRDAQHGFSLTYPADIFSVEHVARQEGGRVFVSEDGASRLLVGAFANEGRYTPASYQSVVARESYDGFDISYAPRGSTWFVLSGEGDGRIFYEKVMFSCGGAVINSFALVYPKAQRGTFDPIVERMENSFRPGTQECR